MRYLTDAKLGTLLKDFIYSLNLKIQSVVQSAISHSGTGGSCLNLLGLP